MSRRLSRLLKQVAEEREKIRNSRQEVSVGTLYKAMGARIRDRRKEIGLTQSELARCCGLERTSITNIELGRQKIQIDALYKVALTLGCSVLELLPGASGASA